MKIRRILAGFITAAIVMPMAMISSSAATITITPTGSNKKYALEITAVATTTEIAFLSGGPELVMSNSGIENSTTGVITSDSKTISVKKVANAKLNNAPLTSTNVRFGFQSKTNEIPAGKYTKFTWTGKLYFSDETKHPKNDLGIILDNFKYNISFDIYVDNIKQTIEFNDFSAKIIEENNEETFKKDTAYSIKSGINNGKGFTVAERQAFKNAKDFKATITLKDTVSSTSLIGFYTDLYYDEPKYSMVNTNTKTVTLDIPKYYFYDEESSALYGSDFMFSSIYLTGAAEFTSVVITYTEGASTPATTTAKPETSTPSNNDSEEAAEDELTLNYQNITINVGASVYLKASYDNVKWSKAKTNGDVISIYTSGKLTGNKTGSTTVTATAPNGDKVTCKVTVVNSSKPLTSYTLNTTKGTVYVDSSYSVSKAKVSATDHTDKINWTTSDPSIATVNASGKVTVNGVGKVTITATTSSGLTSACVLTAKNPSLSLASSNAAINVKGTVAIKTTIKPTNSKVTYESMNEAVATVDSKGVVTGVSKGTAKIEVTSNKGIVKIFTVTVN